MKKLLVLKSPEIRAFLIFSEKNEKIGKHTLDITHRSALKYKHQHTKQNNAHHETEELKMREQRTIGRTFDAEIEVYDKCKYSATLKELDDRRIVRVNDITSWDIVSGEDAKEIEKHTDGSCIDDMHEYLVLHLENGETSTFRNSYVDMFRV